MKTFEHIWLLVCLRRFCVVTTVKPFDNVKLADVRMRDVCILADEKTKTYYAISSTMANNVEGGRRPALRVFTSKDLRSWEGPHIVFQTPEKFWGDINIKAIWAPELIAYKDKYYVFATFDTDSLLPEQWRNWLPRVKRGTQVWSVIHRLAHSNHFRITQRCPLT